MVYLPALSTASNGRTPPRVVSTPLRCGKLLPRHRSTAHPTPNKVPSATVFEASTYIGAGFCNCACFAARVSTHELRRFLSRRAWPGVGLDDSYPVTIPMASTAHRIALASSTNATGQSLEFSRMTSSRRTRNPAKAPTRAPPTHKMTLSIPDPFKPAATIAPTTPANISRATSGAGAVRSGVFGSLSTMYSPIANRVKMIAVTSFPDQNAQESSTGR